MRMSHFWRLEDEIVVVCRRATSEGIEASHRKTGLAESMPHRQLTYRLHFELQKRFDDRLETKLRHDTKSHQPAKAVRLPLEQPRVPDPFLFLPRQGPAVSCHREKCPQGSLLQRELKS